MEDGPKNPLDRLKSLLFIRGDKPQNDKPIDVRTLSEEEFTAVINTFKQIFNDSEAFARMHPKDRSEASWLYIIFSLDVHDWAKPGDTSQERKLKSTHDMDMIAFPCIGNTLSQFRYRGDDISPYQRIL